ncbi:MAG: 50S ribosomal protein L9 [Candidatus Paceibacterota bacterium]|jgi:large subunit ribosomal protein L9
MKVIILKDTAKIGRVGEIKEVSDGHAINFLIPRRLAEKATPERVRALEERMKSKTGAFEGQKNSLIENMKALTGKIVSVKAKANEKGHLYQEIRPAEIIVAVREQLGVSLLEEKIKFEGHYKSVGEFDVSISGAGERVNFKLKVEALG